MDPTTEVPSAEIGLFHRMFLWVCRPGLAYQIVPAKYRNDDGLLIALLFAIALLPFLIEPGKHLMFHNSVLVIGDFILLGFSFFVYVAAVMVLPAQIGGMIHLFLNWVMKSGRNYRDALTLSFLSMGPLVLFFLSWPVLFIGWNSTDVRAGISMFLLSLITLTFYAMFQGMRSIFGFTRLKSAIMAIIPAIPFGYMLGFFLVAATNHYFSG